MRESFTRRGIGDVPRLVDDLHDLLAANAKLLAVAEAARNLTNWDWMCMLDDNESPCTDDVRADVRKLESALAALEAP